MKKYLLFLTTLGVLFAAAFLLPSAAQAEVYSGNCGANGSNLTWRLDTGTGALVISGSGRMKNYDYTSDFPPWVAFGSPKSLTLESGITSIGDYAFYDCSGLTGSLSIPGSVTTIGDFAFNNCSGLTDSLTIPNSVTTIGEGAFGWCSGLTGSLSIPRSVTTIGAGVFRGCSGFTDSLTIPNSVTTIGEAAFDGCSGFTGDLTIPDSVTTIGGFAFQSCSGFRGKLTISNNVTRIGTQTFAECSGFTGNLSIPSRVTTIGGFAFQRCSGFTGNLTIPNRVTSLGEGAFWGCSGFTGLTIGNKVTTIGDYAFFGCSGFTGSLTIPKSVTSIGADAFYTGYNYTEVLFQGNAPSVVPATAASPSFFWNVQLYYENGTTGWETPTWQGYQCAPRPVRVQFAMNDGTNTIHAEQTVGKGQRVRQPAHPLREGFRFVSWYANPRGTGEPWDFSWNRVNADMTLYAKWAQGSGYVLGRDSYCFNNCFKNGGGFFYDGEAWEYSLPDAYKAILMEELSWFDARFINAMLRKDAEGFCLGMSLSNALFFNGNLSLGYWATGVSGVNAVFDLPEPKVSAKMKALISFYHLLQKRPELLALQKAYKSYGDAEVMGRLLDAAQTANRTGVPAVLNFENRTSIFDSFQHSVLITGVTETPTRYVFSILDPGENMQEDENGVWGPWPAPNAPPPVYIDKSAPDVLDYRGYRTDARYTNACRVLYLITPDMFGEILNLERELKQAGNGSRSQRDDGFSRAGSPGTSGEETYTLHVNYSAFTISDGMLYAHVSEEGVTGTLPLDGPYAESQEGVEDPVYSFTLPAGVYTVTPEAVLTGHDYETSMDCAGAAFFAGAKSRQPAAITFTQNGGVRAQSAEPGALVLESAAESLQTDWYGVTVEATQRDMALMPEGGAVHISAADPLGSIRITCTCDWQDIVTELDTSESYISVEEGVVGNTAVAAVRPAQSDGLLASAPLTYTAVFFSNGGSFVTSQYGIAPGATLVEPFPPQREGFVFMGWYADEACSAAYDFSAPVNGDVYVYAKWEPDINYRRIVTFRAEGQDDQLIILHNGASLPLEDMPPVPEGSLGWDTDALTDITQDILINAIYPQTPDPGDLNADRKVTVADAILLVRCMAGLDEPTEKQFLAGDVDPDGDLSMSDVVKVCRYVARIIESLSE